MKFTKWSYEVSATIELSGPELDILYKCSDAHYDSRCQAAFRPGNLGFLYGQVNGAHSFEWKPKTLKSLPTKEMEFKPRELDTMVKILEQATLVYAQKKESLDIASGLWMNLSRTLRELGEEWARVNKA
jgi:hypothetical protein